jgi:TPR repeat protein
VIWYRKAADKGFADAQLSLGRLYAEGQGAPLDLSEAFRLVNLASAGLAAEDGESLKAAAELRGRIAVRLAEQEKNEAERKPGDPAAK